MRSDRLGSKFGTRCVRLIGCLATLVVASDDVRWHNSPKFQVGYEGVFMLDADEVSKLPKVGAAAEAFESKEAFTCLHSVGFQPAYCDKEIATVLDAVGAKKT